MRKSEFLSYGRDLVVSAGAFLDLLYPPVCPICCREADGPGRLVCNRCLELSLATIEPFCLECRQPVTAISNCRNCQGPTVTVFSLGFYDGGLKDILHDLKFESLRPLAEPLGQHLADRIASHSRRPAPDYVIPVPLHPDLENRRGFNQAEEIARALACRLGIELLVQTVYTTRKTRQQSRLPAEARAQNVRGAFAVDDDGGLIKDKTILLVDDVVTTGATLRENARVLKEAGAARIIGAVAAAAV